MNGFPAYAPELAEQGGGFKPEFFAELARLEAGHFWFRARNRLIVWALAKYCPTFESFLEIGCGTGYVLSGICEAYPRAKLFGSEIFTAGLAYSAERMPDVDLMQMDARHIPFVEKFDAIGAFDVLEHVREDEQVLFQVHKALKPGGTLLLTVPQHKWLWSSVDEHACHVRRYAAKDLRAKLAEAGFRAKRSTSFVTLLLPLMAASRYLAGSKQQINALDELRVHPMIGKTLERILDLELLFLRMGLDFPCGGSRLVVAEKV